MVGRFTGAMGTFVSWAHNPTARCLYANPEAPCKGRYNKERIRVSESWTTREFDLCLLISPMQLHPSTMIAIWVVNGTQD